MKLTKCVNLYLLYWFPYNGGPLKGDLENLKDLDVVDISPDFFMHG